MSDYQKMPKRKINRLKNYDYSTPGYYFVTVCTHKKQPVLANIVGNDALVVPTAIGTKVTECFRNIERQNPLIEIDCFCLMPNHLHGILKINSEDSKNGTTGASFPTVSIQKPWLPEVMRAFKSVTTRHYHKICNEKSILWQKSYYDHVIRNEQALFEIRNYIANNPTKWILDTYYI